MSNQPSDELSSLKPAHLLQYPLLPRSEVRISVAKDASLPSSDVRISAAKGAWPLRLMPQTIAKAIAQHAVREPNRPAIVGTQFAPFSFRGLDLWIKQIGNAVSSPLFIPTS